VPNRLRRYYGAGYLHFITFSCYQRRRLLNTKARRDLFLKILEQVRRRYHFVVVGYVVMPEHVHLLIGEPERTNPSVVLQVLKQRFARQLLREGRKKINSTQALLWKTESGESHFWQRRFYDFVVWTERKRVEKLRYIHRNPVKRRLVRGCPTLRGVRRVGTTGPQGCPTNDDGHSSQQSSFASRTITMCPTVSDDTMGRVARPLT
jgi:putative transposase